MTPPCAEEQPRSQDARTQQEPGRRNTAGAKTRARSARALEVHRGLSVLLLLHRISV